MSLEWLEDFACDEATDIANCLYNFKQEHKVCTWCSSRQFCSKLKKNWIEKQMEVPEDG